MAVRHRQDDLIVLRERREREAALEAAVPLIFQQMAESGQIAEPDMVRLAVLFEFWNENCAAHEGCIRRCPEDGLAYRCIRTPSSAARSSLGPPSKATQNWESLSGE